MNFRFLFNVSLFIISLTNANNVFIDKNGIDSGNCSTLATSCLTWDYAIEQNPSIAHGIPTNIQIGDGMFNISVPLHGRQVNVTGKGIDNTDIVVDSTFEEQFTQTLFSIADDVHDLNDTHGQMQSQPIEYLYLSNFTYMFSNYNPIFIDAVAYLDINQSLHIQFCNVVMDGRNTNSTLGTGWTISILAESDIYKNKNNKLLIWYDQRNSIFWIK